MQTKAMTSFALLLLAACGGQPGENSAWSSAAGSETAGASGVEAMRSAQGTATPVRSTAAATAAAPAAAPPAAASGSAVTASGAGVPPAAMAASQASAAPAASAPAAASGSAVTPATSAGAVAAPASGPSGMSLDAETGEVVFRTEPIELAPFDESYTCFAVTVDEDMVIDGFKKGGQLFVHHEQFVKALLPEPEGLSTCNEQFKITWLPIFLAGNGPSELQFDEGVGHVIASGSQLVLQMHLYNATDKPVKEAVEIRMHKSKSANPTPVTPWAIGSSKINIPARGVGQAQNVCMQNDHVEVLAVFPHMHQLGSKMTIEVGKSMDAMKPLYVRDPYNFDDQRMEKMKLELDAGDILRVTCDFKTNASDKAVEFGESSDDEMCFFVGFALGESPAQADCGDLWGALLTL